MTTRSKQRGVFGHRTFLVTLTLIAWLAFAHLLPDTALGQHIKVTTRGYIHASALLYDIDYHLTPDGKREIIVGDMAGWIYCFNAAGTLLWEYDASLAFDTGVTPIYRWMDTVTGTAGNVTIQSSAAAGDIDGDFVPEIVVGVGGFVDGGAANGRSTNFGPVGQGGILVLNGDGTFKLLVRGWDTFDGMGGFVQDGFSDGFFSTPALGDIDRDGRLDVVIGGTDQNIYALKVQMAGINNAAPAGSGFYHPPKRRGLGLVPIYELDDDVDGRFNEDPFGDLTPINYSGLGVPGYPGVDDDLDNCTDEGGLGGTPGLPWDDDEDASPYLLSCNNTIPPVPFQWWDEDEFEWPFRNTDTVISSPALARIDGDSFLDVVIGADSSGAAPLKPGRKAIATGGALRVMNRLADELGAFPQHIEQVVWSSPVVADIDEDGSPEIFVGTGFVLPSVGMAVYAFNHDGSPYIPANSPTGVFATTTGRVFGAPAVGDVDNDGDLDVAATDFAGLLYAWDKNGTLLSGFPVDPISAAGFPNPPAQIRSSVVLADVDDDSVPEMIIGVGPFILAVNGDGTVPTAFQESGPNKAIIEHSTLVMATPAAADLDNDGLLNLVWTTGENDTPPSENVDRGAVHIWEIDDSNHAANVYPAFKRNGSRTSSYTLSFDNPIFSPSLLDAVETPGTVTVSVDVNQGLYAISQVGLSFDVNGSPIPATLVDNGTGADPIAGDGRYFGTFVLPNPVNEVGTLELTASSIAGPAGTETASRLLTTELLSFRLKTRDFVTDYYNSILGRGPDALGLAFWSDEIARVATVLGIDVKEGLIALASLFFSSAEYIAQNNSNDDYVVDLYQTFLRRTPSQGEIDSWSAFLDQGLPRPVLLTNFAVSTEFRLVMEQVFGALPARAENDMVNDFYRGTLDRLPDTVGFEGWSRLMQGAQCQGEQPIRDLSNQIASSFVNSAEYAARGRTNRQYVEDLYNAILKRGATPGEFDAWEQDLNSAAKTRAQVLDEFTASAEFGLRVQGVIDQGCIE